MHVLRVQNEKPQPVLRKHRVTNENITFATRSVGLRKRKTSKTSDCHPQNRCNMFFFSTRIDDRCCSNRGKKMKSQNRVDAEGIASRVPSRDFRTPCTTYLYRVSTRGSRTTRDEHDYSFRTTYPRACAKAYSHDEFS